MNVEQSTRALFGTDIPDPAPGHVWADPHGLLAYKPARSTETIVGLKRPAKTRWWIRWLRKWGFL